MWKPKYRYLTINWNVTVGSKITAKSYVFVLPISVSQIFAFVEAVYTYEAAEQDEINLQPGLHKYGKNVNILFW